MEYYGASRGRSSYRGSRGFRGESSYRGSRGFSRGSSYSGRGRGSGSAYNKYDDGGSTKYNSSESKYGSPSSRYEDSYPRRSESSYSPRDNRSDMSDIISRKRVRSESYSLSQGFNRRVHDDDDYRGTTRYSESRSYDEPRTFKKPRIPDYKPRDDYRMKESSKPRASRGRVFRGSVRRGRDPFVSRRRGTASRAATATTSEILAIRRAKLLQDRQKSQTAAADEKSTATKPEEVETAETGDEKKAEAAAVAMDVVEEEVAPKEDRITNKFGKSFVKLNCPHCAVKCITYREYTLHLEQPLHVRAMKDKVEELKTTLATMRIAQREKQKTADEEDLTSMNTRSYFCAICKLNYSQEKATHQSSELHKKLKTFLSPYCKICAKICSNPMAYEVHICSLSHLRRKHFQEEREKKSGVGDLFDKFMVLDSVGSGDEADEKEPEEEVPEEEPKGEDLTLGIEFIRSVKVMYCEVCRRYLPRGCDDSVLKRHCRKKEHLRCYLHYGNDKLLKKMNESVEEERKQDKDKEAGTTTKEGETKEGEEVTLDGDKLWDDVGELLSETQPHDKSDDEDEEEGGRFDRFKSKEKKENGDITETEAVVEGKLKSADAVAAAVIA